MAQEIKKGEIKDEELENSLQFVVSSRGFTQAKPIKLSRIIDKRQYCTMKKFHISERPEIRIYCEIEGIARPEFVLSVDTVKTEYVFFL